MIKISAKKLISILFIFAVLISVLPLSNIGTVPATASSYTCTSEKLQSLINQYSGSYWNGSYNSAYKCKGFADMMFNAMYGTGGVGRYNSGYHYYVPQPREAVEIARDSSATYDEVYDMMHKAQSGDYIQWSRGYSQHSAIFVSCDENGFYIFDCNYISPNICGVHYVTFSKLARTNYGVSVYRSNFSEAIEKEEAEEIIEEPKPVEFGFAHDSYELAFDETANPTVNGATEIIKWETSDNGVAVVDGNGKIKAVGNGTASITVTNIDGKTAVCIITVKCSAYKHVIEGFLQGFEPNEILTKAIFNK